jgi:glycosyltransferase involved in cell wall biosynthesis
MKFSFIIPVYNRSEELHELLHSIRDLQTDLVFDVIVIDDGSYEDLGSVVNMFRESLDLNYFKKENSGPADSRNFGMARAKGDFFVFLDSDVILPPSYLDAVYQGIERDKLQAFGGPDRASDNFSNFQKAVSYSMTSLLTTGGIRGSESRKKSFFARSFNMGISSEVYKLTNGFSDMRFGEDIDLSIRIQRLNLKSGLILNAFVYHKRRTNVVSFFKQTFQFGTARPILNRRYPDTAKLTYWFPTIFIVGLLMALIFWALNDSFLLLAFYGFYTLLISYDSTYKNKSFSVGILTIITTLIQFSGYGIGFLKSRFTKA